MSGLKPYPEQEAIVAADVDVLKVDAKAGTGKTTTLVRFSKARPGKKFLYLAYNKPVQIEASGKFPSNVEVRTSHSIAYRPVGSKYREKLVGGIRPFEAVRLLKSDMRDIPQNMEMQYGTRITNALNRFIMSPDEAVSKRHIYIDEFSPEARYFSVEKMIKHTQAIWNEMCKIDSTKVGMTHDGYLKLFLHSGISPGNFDYVLFDEAQDASPVTLEIVKNLDGRKVYVGDPYQAIYGFRGAIDAMDHVNEDLTLRLTNSFRFGDNVANCANTMLAYLRSEHCVRGVGGEDRIIPAHLAKQSRHSFISRNNSSLIMKAKEVIDMGGKVHFLGGIENYRFDQIMDVYNMYKKEGRPKDAFLKCFETFDQLDEYVDSSKDGSVRSLVRLVKAHKEKLPSILARIQAKNTPERRDADVLLMTAHKAKGLEFDTVMISDDFNVGVDEVFPKEGREKERIMGTDGMYLPSSPEEVNLAYVAITRASKEICIPKGIREVIEHDDMQKMTTTMVGRDHAIETVEKEVGKLSSVTKRQGRRLL